MRVLFWGTPDFAVPTLRALSEEGHAVVGVVTQPDRPAGRGRAVRPSPVKEVAEELGIPVLTPEKPVGPEFLDALRALSPEVSVVVAYGHILSPEVLELPERGSWNLHASLLPELRGAAPIHWAIARGYDRTGVTVMRMTEGMDAGPILHQVDEPIHPEETSAELTMRLSEIGAQAFIEGMAMLEWGEAEPVEQDHDAATYAPKVSREVARVDWTLPAARVRDHIRAMDDVPGAWSEWNGTPVKLFRPRLGDPSDAEPGTVVVADPDRGLALATGEGSLWIDHVQPPGKTRMPARAWLRGRGAQEGERFE